MTDLETMSRGDLMKLRANVDRAIATVADRDKRNALKAAEEAARGHGFSLADLMDLMGGGRPARAAKGASRSGKPPAEARFRNPDNAEQTWSGRGRRPRWLNEAQAAGRPLEEMRIR